MKNKKGGFKRFFLHLGDWAYCIKENLKSMIRSLPHNYLTKNQMEQLNDSIAQALKREKMIMNSIDFLIIETASSGYYSQAEIYEIRDLANKEALKSLFASLKRYKNFVEESYYSMELDEIMEVRFNLLEQLKELQTRMNRFMEFFAIVREDGHVPVEKLHFDDDWFQALSA